MLDETIKQKIINDYAKGFSLGEISKKYNIKSKSYIRNYILNGKVRNFSESGKLAHMKYPERFKHSEETKRKMRCKRIEWMKEHPEKTAWRLKNMSYPEKCFKKMLEDADLDKKYLIYREFPVFPYYIDFAFYHERVAIEIDGSQHLLEERKLADDKKDICLQENGWRILRIAAKEVIKYNDNILNSLYELLGNNKVNYLKVGILKSPSKYKKVERDEDGFSELQKLYNLRQRKVDRPSSEELMALIKYKSFREIGRMFGVSDNAIRKWCKCYKIPHRKKDLLKITS